MDTKEIKSKFPIFKNKINGKYTAKVLNVNDGIPAIMNSDSMKQIRREMLDGEVPSVCMTCYNLEQSGGHSKRNRETIIEEDVIMKFKNREGNAGDFYDPDDTPAED